MQLSNCKAVEAESFPAISALFGQEEWFTIRYDLQARLAPMAGHAFKFCISSFLVPLISHELHGNSQGSVL